VKLLNNMRWRMIVTLHSSVCLMVAATVATSAAATDKKDKTKPPAEQAVDSGSFGVFVKGQRVVTEKFSIHQENGVNLIKSEVKDASGADQGSQKSTLEITSGGELLRYEWSQSTGNSLTVLPNNDFLMEKITTAGSSKAAEKPFLMPSSSSILDNNFFVQREVLAWRYLAEDCKSDGGQMKCKTGPGQFGVLVPQAQTSMSLRLEVVDSEKVTIHGAQRDLLKLKLSGESYEWELFVDPQDQFKLIKVAIPADNTEVIRD
jgi:hypothetical protein